MRNLFAVAIACVSLTATVLLPRPARAADTDAVYFVFLDKGTNTTHVTKEQNQAMFEKHIGNFNRLADVKKLIMAGPLGDEGETEGIVILTVPTMADVRESFLPDPFVQNKYMNADAFRWYVDRTKIHAWDMPVKMVVCTIRIVKKGPNWVATPAEGAPPALESVLPSVSTLTASSDLAIAGSLQGSPKLAGVLLFRTKDIKTLRATLDKDPSVVAGHVNVELHPLWVAHGVLGP